jgi:UMF1 family MFS transporter
MNRSEDKRRVPRGEIFSWAMFDFANSAYITVVVTVVGGLYFKNVLMAGRQDAEFWWGAALGLANAIVVVLSPVVGALGDVMARKKFFLLVSYVMCFSGTVVFGLPTGWAVALAGLVVAHVGFALGENLVSSFLPEIARPEEVGRISALGWGIGYFGGLASLGLALVVIEVLKWPAGWGILVTAFFFALAGLPTLLFLRERAVAGCSGAGEAVGGALSALWSTALELPRHRNLGLFFVSFFCVMAGLGNVVMFASLFAEEQLRMSQGEIIGMFVLLQLAAAAGAWFFGWLQDAAGSKTALSVAVVVWVGVVLGVFFVRDKMAFYFAAVFAGLAMGGAQCTARAVVGLLAPAGRSGEFYGFWGVFGKLSAVVGAPLFGWVASVTDLRSALLSTLTWFVVGFFALLPVRVPAARGES